MALISEVAVICARFRYCTSDGLLLYATGSSGHYLALGVQSSRLVLVFYMGNGVQEVSVH